MASLDHYENGEWVGSTDVPGDFKTTGWVDTYSKDGKRRSTWVSNTNMWAYDDSTSSSDSPSDSKSFWKGIRFLSGLWYLFMPIVNIFFFLRLRKRVKSGATDSLTEVWLYNIGKFFLIITCVDIVLLLGSFLISSIASYFLGEPLTFWDYIKSTLASM